MANQLAALPWMVDTLSDTPFWEGKAYVDHINYVGFQDPAHVARVLDRDGNEVALLSGNTNATTYHNGHWVQGLAVPLKLEDGTTDNMPSGHLLIYLK